ncbi:MAG: hypothetical protein PUA96_09165 [Bacteroidales bacterium]|nr:hypothetical protein [Bacteroidales bacterium]
MTVIPYPNDVTVNCGTFNAALKGNGFTRTITLDFNENKALGRPVTLNSEPMPKYKLT